MGVSALVLLGVVVVGPMGEHPRLLLLVVVCSGGT
jgi:hypothetical protein